MSDSPEASAPASPSYRPASDVSAPTPTPRRTSFAWLWLLLLVLLAGGGWYGWKQWQMREARDRAAVADADLRLDALDERINALRNDQRSQNRRLQQADATNRVLRDELHGIGTRASLIEDSVSKLADPDRHGAQAMRLDETELLLTLGQQRLQIAGDLAGARRAYALAGGVLDGIDDPAYLSLRQTLMQERAALDALGIDPRVRAGAQLDAFARTLSLAPVRDAQQAAPQAPWWQRAFGNIVDVQPSDGAVALRPADRAIALAGLQLEISLARAAAERRDEAGYRNALTRADGWLQRLAPASAAQTRQRDTLKSLAALPLSLSVPTLGSTLQQLRQLRTTR
ncbi:uroporphyrinogen-III C-methyltransferase [Lysobacter sp. 5GHs7-4]|uniref:uroporphyrinogen-III C-methyltransferase n=1 Tax=Lysobacter sp. 5GHs7-4 TaxID=2904253 RepID=UPI001E5C0D97|nr:uroporphyrinogen-III C-methyltransferase [Lysobacter sp. 5GHs7-4]UHQ23583.1 uroporphyrinogen-III C-methyltransferase [Lysobacter sp. 5GHs7-4]